MSKIIIDEEQESKRADKRELKLRKKNNKAMEK